MPYFKWYALDQQGDVHLGVDFVRSVDQLNKNIRKKGFVTLLMHAPARTAHSRITLMQRADFFRQLGSMLQAGVRITDALALVQVATAHEHFKMVIADCIQAIEEGIPFSQACAFHESWFTPFACQLLHAGEVSGKLAVHCIDLADYYCMLDQFSKKIRAALIMPCITIASFVVVLAILLLIVIPRFAILLQSFNRPLAWRTQLLIDISSWLQHHWLLMIIACIASGYALYCMVQRIHTKTWFMRVPIVGRWIAYTAAISFFRTLGSLLSSGVDIVQALAIATHGIAYRPLAQRYQHSARLVESGEPILHALEEAGIIIAPACKALLVTGESIGKLGPFLVRCADYYQQELSSMLHTISTLVQPILLALLGLLIAGLVLALYEPIFTLSTIAL